jgi:hypothetical protein
VLLPPLFWIDFELEVEVVLELMALEEMLLREAVLKADEEIGMASGEEEDLVSLASLVFLRDMAYAGFSFQIERRTGTYAIMNTIENKSIQKHSSTIYNIS